MVEIYSFKCKMQVFLVLMISIQLCLKPLLTDVFFIPPAWLLVLFSENISGLLNIPALLPRVVH